MDIEHKAIHCIGNIHPRMIVDRNKELSATEYQQRNIESKEASAWVKGAKLIIRAQMALYMSANAKF